MLEFTGVIGGEMVESKPVTIAQLCKHFGVEIPENLVIERITSKRDRFGQRKESAQALLNPYFSAVFGGQQFMLRYYQSKAKRPDKTESYLPKKIRFAGTKVFNTNEQELAVFLMLHPQNAASPFASRQVHVKTSDKNAEATARLTREKFEASVRAMVLTEPDASKIQRVARGFNHKGKTISTIHTSDPATARIELLDMAKLYPDAVKEALDDEATIVRGIVGLAEDMGKLVLRNNTWTIGAEVILEVTKMDNPLERIYEYLSLPANLTKFLSKVFPEAKTEASESDLIQSAIDAKRLVIEDDGRAFILDENGDKSGYPIGKFESYEALASATLAKPIIGRIKKAMQ